MSHEAFAVTRALSCDAMRSGLSRHAVTAGGVVLFVGVIACAAVIDYQKLTRKSPAASSATATAAPRSRPAAATAHDAQAKKRTAETILETEDVFIHLDPRRTGVIVPERFKSQADLVLQVGRDMPIPIPDLDVGDEGITGTLSFDRKPFHCVLPWSSIFALVDHDNHGRVWEDDVPAELAAQIAKGRDAGTR